MAEIPDDHDEAPWDEFQWERFLQEQDRKTDTFATLYERYFNHPDRDRIIAEEMGWSIFADAEEDQERFESFLSEAMDHLSDAEEQEFDDEFEEYSRSVAYDDTLRLHRWINRLMDKREELRENPHAAKFALRAAVCGAKLAAGFCGHDPDEVGMTIAYLKRALHAANDSLDALSALEQEGSLDRRRANHGRRLVFKVRDRIVVRIGECRVLWRTRQG